MTDTQHEKTPPASPSDAAASTPSANAPPLVDFRLDLRGESCPYPVIHTLEALAQMEEGQSVEVISDCPQAYRNIPDEAVNVGSRMLTEPLREGAQMSFLLEKGKPFDTKRAIRSAKAADRARRRRERKG